MIRVSPHKICFCPKQHQFVIDYCFIASFILLTLILLYKGISADPTCVYFNSLDLNDKAEQEVWRTERLFD